jgi:hypothetical protein
LKTLSLISSEFRISTANKNRPKAKRSWQFVTDGYTSIAAVFIQASIVQKPKGTLMVAGCIILLKA